MEKIRITTKNYDVIFKNALIKYKDDIIDFLKIECPAIIDIEPTELPEIEAYVNNTDFIFELEDGTLLHFEFQADYDKEDIRRFMLYDTRLYVKRQQKIRTIVVCKNSDSDYEEINGGSFNYRTEIKSLKGYNAEEVLGKDDITEVELIFVPLMESKMSISDRIKKAMAAYRKKVKSERKIMDFAATMLVLANRLISRDEFREIWEEIKMLNIIRFAEEMGEEKGIEKGIQKGIEKGKIEGLISTAKNLFEIGIETATVKKVTGLSDEELEKIKSEI